MSVNNSDRLCKSDRLNYIVNRMRVRQDITPTGLAEELNVSERTIYRDLRNLEKENALQKRYSRREGHYLLENELNLTPLTLTPSEAIALLTAASNPALAEDNFYALDLRRSLDKVAAALMPSARQEHGTGTNRNADLKSGSSAGKADQKAGNKKFNSKSHAAKQDASNNADAPDAEDYSDSSVSPAADSIQRPIIETVRRAIRSNHKLKLRYWTGESDCEYTHVVAPYDLRRIQRHWYLLACVEDQGVVRAFKISRVRSLEALPDRFRYPRRFSADASFERAWEADGGDEEIQVQVWFAPAVAGLVRGTCNPQFTRLETQADGSLIGTACVPGFREIGWWVLSYGSQAEILSPPELRQRFARTVQEMAARYSQNPAPLSLADAAPAFAPGEFSLRNDAESSLRMISQQALKPPA